MNRGIGYRRQHSWKLPEHDDMEERRKNKKKKEERKNGKKIDDRKRRRGKFKTKQEG